MATTLIGNIDPTDETLGPTAAHFSRLSRKYDIRSFGAQVGTAVDNTAAIQAAIDAAVAESRYGSVVYVPPGRWGISGNVQMKEGVALEGEGESSMLYLNNGADDHMIVVDGAVSRPKVRNLCLYGNRDNQTANRKHAIFIDGQTSSYVSASILGLTDPYGVYENLFIYRVNGDGIHITGPSRGENHFRGIKILNAENGVYMNSFDNWLTDISCGGVKGDGFIVLQANNRLVNCKSWFTGDNGDLSGSGVGNGGYGFYLTSGARGCILAGCETQDTNAHGYFIGGNSNALAGCTCDAPGSLDDQFSQGDGTFTEPWALVIEGVNNTVSGFKAHDRFFSSGTLYGGVLFQGAAADNDVSAMTLSSFSGPAYSDTSGNANWARVNGINYGPFTLSGIPTSDPGVEGRVWSDNGVLTISAGL